MLKKISLITVSSIAVFALNTAVININEKDLELSIKMDINNFQDNVKSDGIYVGLKLLNGDSDNSNRKHQSNSLYGEVSFLMEKDVSIDGLSLGLGVKANYTQLGSQDFISIPLGIEGHYKLPLESSIPLYIISSIYYAPQVLSFIDAKSFFEFRAGLDIEVIDNGLVTLGYRLLDTNYDISRGDYTYNKSFYGGFKFLF